MRIILAGCGGTGTELLKLLGNEDNELLLVDHDKITLSNLHRLSIFSKEDQGKYKSQRAAEIINSGYRSTAKFLIQKIEDLSIDTLDQYDVVIAALDNVEGRMDLNFMFKQSSCRLLIDCGINGYRAHVKAVHNNSACLYCIRDLYRNESDLNICSLRSVPRKITSDNKENVLRSLVELERDRPGDKISKIERITNNFNVLVEVDSLRTTMFDVAGIYDDIMPNVCFINSICASLACTLLNSTDLSFDYIFYSGEDGISFTKLLLSRDEECIVCNLDSPIGK